MYAVNSFGSRVGPARPVVEVKARESVLIKFTHGLGDAVQLTIVLKHLAKYRPEWDVFVATLPGKDSCFHGLCRETVLVDSDEHKKLIKTADRKFQLEWWENYSKFGNAPQTKVTNCLKEIFGIDPDLSLYRYSIAISDDSLRVAGEYLSRICGSRTLANGRFPAVCIHYQANTSNQKKDLPHFGIRDLCGRLLGLGYVPIILDWDRRSPIPDGESVFCPTVDEKDLWRGYGTGDAERLAALISRCALMIGVDSGPLHVAGATDTPTIGVWTDHPPIMFFDLCPNVTHLLPAPWTDRAPFNNPDVEQFFRQHYRFKEYRHMKDIPDSEQVFTELENVTEAILQEGGEELQPRPGFKTWVAGALTSQSYGREYYEQHREAGLDYLNFGDWQRNYGRWFVESLGLQRKHVLDVGCACGSIVRGLGEAGCFVSGCDVSEHMIALAKRTWPDMRPILHCCDAINLHLWRDGTFDAIHSAQSAEHWRPDHVPLILAELLRVTKPGGLLWVSLDTQELYDRQNRDPASEDATHVCIKPMAWWLEQLAAAGWITCTEDVRPAMTDRADSYFKMYDWDWFAAMKSGSKPVFAPGMISFRGDLAGDGEKTSQQVLPDLAVGSFIHVPEFAARGWNCITVANASPESIQAKRIPLIDGTGNSPDRLRECVLWMVEAWGRGEKVFMSCRSGANRSPGLCAAALAVSGRHKSMREAYEWLRSVRREIGHWKGTQDEIEAAIQPLLQTRKPE